MQVSKFTLAVLILIIVVLLAAELSMYAKVKGVKDVVTKLNQTIQQQGAVIEKLAR